jgi:glycosyltransferase involved in cell wall biosynthesis
MRILFSLLDAGIGGGQRIASQIAERLVDEGDEVGLVVPEQGPAVERFEKLGAAIHLYDLRRIRRPNDVNRVARSLASYDLLYSHTGTGGQILGDTAARRARRPHLVHQHTFPQFSSRGVEATAQRALFRLLLARRPFIVVAPHVRRELIRLGAEGSNAIVIPNGVVLPALDRRPPTSRVGLLGRFDPGKGMHTFIGARAFVGPEAHFVIGASSGPFGEYERSVRNAAAHANVEIDTPGEDGEDFLRSLDVVVIPSRYEGCPLVLLEAMALGKPVVASDIAGIRAVTGTGGATLVPMDNAEALGSAIAGLLSDEHARIELGTEARRIVKGRFTLERMLSGATNEIRRVLGTRA